MSENCPKCGSELLIVSPHGATDYKCRTYEHNGTLYESSFCLQTQLTALTQRAEQAERERDELKAAAWCLEKPDDASHQETLNMIDELWRKKVSPVMSFLDQARALIAAEAEVKRLEAKLAQSTNYVADDDTYPHAVWFANGRKVSIASGGHLKVGMGDT